MAFGVIPTKCGQTHPRAGTQQLCLPAPCEAGKLVRGKLCDSAPAGTPVALSAQEHGMAEVKLGAG